MVLNLLVTCHPALYLLAIQWVVLWLEQLLSTQTWGDQQWKLYWHFPAHTSTFSISLLIFCCSSLTCWSGGFSCSFNVYCCLWVNEHVILKISHNFLSRYPPIALQPSLGHFFSHVNDEWRKGYKAGLSQSSPKLSNVVVVSVSGGIHDYQVSF